MIDFKIYIFLIEGFCDGCHIKNISYPFFRLLRNNLKYKFDSNWPC
jgi:hypothetical protein